MFVKFESAFCYITQKQDEKSKAVSQIVFLELMLLRLIWQTLHGYTEWKTSLAKNIKISRVYNKCNMKNVMDTDFWNIRLFEVLPLAKLHVCTYIYVGDIMLNLIIGSNIFWSNIVSNKEFAVGRSNLVGGWWKNSPCK